MEKDVLEILWKGVIPKQEDIEIIKLILSDEKTRGLKYSLIFSYGMMRGKQLERAKKRKGVI